MDDYLSFKSNLNNNRKMNTAFKKPQEVLIQLEKAIIQTKQHQKDLSKKEFNEYNKGNKNMKFKEDQVKVVKQEEEQFEDDFEDDFEEISDGDSDDKDNEDAEDARVYKRIGEVHSNQLYIKSVFQEYK